MKVEYIALLSGLFGSIFTVLIGKILEIIQKKYEFTYSLKLKYFEKKLESAEKAIIYSSLISGVFNNLAFMFKEIPKLDNKNARSSLLKIQDSFSEQIKQANEILKKYGDSTMLYFDFGDSILNTTSFPGTFFSLLNDLYNIKKERDILISQIGKDGKIDIDEINNQLDSTQKLAVEKVNALSKLMSEVEKGVKENIKVIRKEFKKLDV